MEPSPVNTHSQVGAVILGAGQSRRMGQPKLLLPWGEKTIIAQIVFVLQKAGIAPITVVTGAEKQAIETALAGSGTRFAHNPDYQTTEMTESLKIGLAAQLSNVEAVLVVLGDQPGIEEAVVSGVVRKFQEDQAALIVPSYQKRRGHPWLLGRSLWQEVLSLGPDSTLRDFLNTHASQIAYLNVDTPSILKDLDTPQDYLAARPPTSTPPQ